MLADLGQEMDSEVLWDHETSSLVEEYRFMRLQLGTRHDPGQGFKGE